MWDTFCQVKWSKLGMRLITLGKKWMIIHTFYNGLLYYTGMALDVASSGDLMNNNQDVAYNLIEEMAKNHRSQGSV